MNILVVNPPNRPFTNMSILAEPLDVLQIATVIEQEYPNVKVIDMDVNRMDNNINNYLGKENIVVFVYDYQLPLHTSQAVDNIFEIVKNTNQYTKFIMIGKTSSFFYDKFLENGIDIVIKEMAEGVINEVIKDIDNVTLLKTIPNIVFKDNSKIIHTESKKVINNYQELPMINRSLVDISKYMDTRTLISSRGCIGTCKFCTTPYYFKNWSGKTAIQVVEEIEMLINKYQAHKIMFLDDNATVSKKRMMDICELLKKKRIKCLYGALCSIKCYDKEMLQTMYDVGFRWVHFGLESGSKQVLDKMGKKMDIEDIKKIIQEVKNMGYRVRTSFILDYPGTTIKDLKATQDLILKIKPHEIRLHYLAYRVGTPVYDENQNILNKSQYIHSNKPNVANKDLDKAVNELLNELHKIDYHLIMDDINWNIYNNQDKDIKIVAFTPIKYGMCWYE